MKNVFTVFFFLVISLVVFAQAKIEFTENTYDFGAVVEGDLATYTFKFKNIGDDTLLLQSVKPSCGCTSPYWAKDPVLPGMTGEIKVQYNSKNRPGQFNKSINIVSNTIQPNTKLKIKGVVLPPINSAISKDSIAKSASIYVTTTEYLLGELERKQQETFDVLIENKGTSVLKIHKVSAGCGCVYSNMKEFEVAPGQSKTLQLKLSAGEIGNLNATAILQTNDPITPYFTLIVKAVVKASLRQDNMMQTTPGSGF